jgi:hypothetical protein
MDVEPLVRSVDKLDTQQVPGARIRLVDAQSLTRRRGTAPANAHRADVIGFARVIVHLTLERRRERPPPSTRRCRHPR